MNSKQAKKAYSALLREFSSILYEEDPEGMGSSLHSPADEYDMVAAQLIVDFRGARHIEERIDCLRRKLPAISSNAVSRLSAAWDANQLSS